MLINGCGHHSYLFTRVGKGRSSMLAAVGTTPGQDVCQTGGASLPFSCSRLGLGPGNTPPPSSCGCTLTLLALVGSGCSTHCKNIQPPTFNKV